MNNNEQQQPKLTDEEVWLRAYCAAFNKESMTHSARVELSDRLLIAFRERFEK